MAHTQVKVLLIIKSLKQNYLGLKWDIDNIASKGKFGMGLNNA